jgi:hypothetical protein
MKYTTKNYKALTISTITINIKQKYASFINGAIAVTEKDVTMLTAIKI